MDYNTGAMRSPFSPRVRQSLSGRRQIGLGSAKNNTSKYNQPEDVGGDVIYKTPLITLETYGPPLPVMVTEALTFANGVVSVRLSGCGWCWVVAGRRVLAWPVDGPACPGPSAARELTLPQTDLAHKADLVMLFYEDGAQMPSCIGVSPEGVVRYWASVGQEGAYVDVSCELAGQECDRIACSRSKAPLVLATTTCTLVLLTPSTIDGRGTVSCRTLRPPSGWLGGLGRRVSLMFFGSMPAHLDTKLVGVAVVGAGAGAGEAGGCIALVAGGGAGGGGVVLQVWCGAELHEHELGRALLPHVPLSGAAGDAPRALQLRAGAGPSDLLLLFAQHAMPPAPQDARHYIAQISLEEVSAPRVTRLVALRGGGAAEEPPAFLPLPAHVLLYTRLCVALHPAGGAGAGEPECLELGAEGDRILGGELAPAGALLFSLRHGLLRVKPHAQQHRAACEPGPAAPPPALDMYEGSLSLYEIDPLEVSQQSLDLCGQLKTAFLFHVRRDSARCKAMLAALAGGGGGGGAPDEALDRTVVRVAREMLDDAPQGDPRWPATTTALALGRSPALQLAQQLADKRRVFALFLDFLQATHLLQRLQTLTFEGSVIPSASALWWLGGLLGVGMVLRARQEAGAAPVGAAVLAAVARGLDEEEPSVAAALQSGALSADDVCYRRVSALHRVLHELARAAPAPPHACAERARLLALLAAALDELARARLCWPHAEAPPPEPARRLLPPLRDLVAASVRCCGGAEAGGACVEVLERASALADALLALAAPLSAAQHDALRDDLIRPFVEAGQLERAGALAERHGALRLLVEMCVREGDAPRLLRYVAAHAERGMVELACERLAGARRVRHLVAGLGAAHGERLRAWLARGRGREPGALAALLALQERAPAAAAAALARLAEAERGSVRRARTAASLGKLCLAAQSPEAQAGTATLGRQLERRLTLCAAQAALPRALRLAHALDGADAEPLEPEELVQVYVSAQAGAQAALSEHEYKAALELAELVEDAERREALRRDVWCAAVLTDTWDAQHADPREDLHHRCFFRLLDLLHVSGAPLEQVLPPLQELLEAPALAELVARPAVQHLLRYGYECLAPPPRAASA